MSSASECAVVRLVEHVQNSVQFAKRHAPRCCQFMERIEVLEVDGYLGVGWSFGIDCVPLTKERAVRVSVQNLEHVCVLKAEKRRRHRQVHAMTIQKVQKDRFRPPMVVWREDPQRVEGISKLLWQSDVSIDLPQNDCVNGLLREGLIRQRVKTSRQIPLVLVPLQVLGEISSVFSGGLNRLVEHAEG
jgi:hypothetical protein